MAGRPSPFRRRDRLLAFLPPLLLAAMVAAWGVDLPYFDQWELIPRFQIWLEEGRFPWRELWNFHNEHRLLVPELIMLGVGRLTGWNILVELGINLLLAGLLFFVLARQLRELVGADGRFSPALPVLSLLIFSPSQWGNWSWGWQIQIFLAVLLVAVAVYLLSRPSASWPAFTLATLAAMTAPFSFANGLLLFPLALPLVLWRKEARFPRTLLWLLAGATVYHLYGIDKLSPRFRALSAGSFADRLFAQVDYFLHYLAGPVLAAEKTLPLVVYGLVPLSLLGLLAALVFGWRVPARRGEMLPWLTLAMFGLASAAMTAYGRFDFGSAQALSSRYFTIANFYWLGLFGLALIVAKELFPRRLPRPVVLVAAGLALCFLANAALGARQFRSDSLHRRWLRAALLGQVELNPTIDLPAILPYPDRQAVVERIETMRRLKLSVFR